LKCELATADAEPKDGDGSIRLPATGPAAAVQAAGAAASGGT
jgi:hypothetical protein